MALLLIKGVVLAQIRATRHNVEDLLPVLTQPLFILVAIPVFLHAGKPELAGYGLVAALLMTIGQMAFYVASEAFARERWEQTLELVVASPASCGIIILTRVMTLTTIGAFGFAESWLIARFAFGIRIVIHHPWVMLAALAATTLAAAGSAVLTAALFSLTPTVRTLQHAVNGPLYLLGGVLVPVAYLPPALQHLSPIVFFYWSANLMRDSLQATPPANILLSLSAILGLGLITGALGILVLRRMLDRLRAQGTLGIT